MGNKIIRSIRGEEVNFDLNQYKNEMGAVPETETVRYRENLIQTRRKRKNSSNRKVREMMAEQQQNEAAVRKALEKQKIALVTDATINTDAMSAISPVDDPLDVSTTVSDESVENSETKINRKIKGKQ